ncbi:MAG: cytosolic protein [Dyadobacter sp.]|uniref:PmeII family type II restriction endonuclease n=1 Tax=Dyadobacter sp. TaxID=1914288 RepID=UPI001B2239E6|nr:PmeII family type II restriction endonuclease [Dyadobacter sp.]MBO9615416.1 cytosolic protein [Dyadobacter sp.]
MDLQQFTLIENFIHEEVVKLHENRYKKLKALTLGDIVYRKNLYMFKAKYLLTADEVVKSIISAYISSSEESTFGNLLEQVAIKVSEILEGGKKSSSKAADLELDRNGIRYLVNIKSGPNWGNSSQIAKMIDNFKNAQRTLRTSNANINVRFINGCCYGVDDTPNKLEYEKLCGQRFWEFLTEEADFYLRLIEPLGFQAKEKSELFNELYTQKVNIFTGEFIKSFVDDGLINWEKLISAGSAIRRR